MFFGKVFFGISIPFTRNVVITFPSKVPFLVLPILNSHIAAKIPVNRMEIQNPKEVNKASARQEIHIALVSFCRAA